MRTLMEYLAAVVVQDACALLSSSDADIQAAAKGNRLHRYLLRQQAFRDKLQEYQQKLAAGGYDMLRPLSIREEVQQLHVKVDSMTALMQQQQNGELQHLRDQLQQRKPPRSLEDEEYEQQQAFEGMLKAAAAAGGGDSQADSEWDEPTMTADPKAAPATAPCRGRQAAAAAAAPATTAATETLQGLPTAAQEQIADLHAKVKALQQQLAEARTAQPLAATVGATDAPQGPGKPAGPGNGPASEPGGSGPAVRRSARQQRRQLGQQQEDARLPERSSPQDDTCSQSPAAHKAPQQQQQQQQPSFSAAETVDAAYTAPFQQLIGSKRQPQQQQSTQPARPRVSLQGQRAATACSDAAVAYEGPFKGLMGKVQPAHVVTTQFAASAAVGAHPQQSIAEVAAAAAAQAAAAATGGDHAAVAAAAAQAAAQAAAAMVVPGLLVQPTATRGPDSATDGTGNSQEPVGRAMPTPGSFVKYQGEQVQKLWEWYVAPYDGGKSDQEMESARLPQIAWRQQQKYGNQRWRQLNLVLQRVHELAQQGTRVLPGRMAAREVDQERISLGLDLPKYIKHLEAQAAVKNAAKNAATSTQAAGPSSA